MKTGKAPCSGARLWIALERGLAKVTEFKVTKMPKITERLLNVAIPYRNRSVNIWFDLRSGIGELDLLGVWTRKAR